MKLLDGLTKRQRKKKNAALKGSTPGTSKVMRCKKHVLKTQFAKDNRFYRTDPKGYERAEEYFRTQT